MSDQEPPSSITQVKPAPGTLPEEAVPDSQPPYPPAEPMTEKGDKGEELPAPEYPGEGKPKHSWRNAKIVDKSVWFKCECGFFKLKLNPIVTISSIILVLAFILWCILAQEHASDSFTSAKSWITRTFTWLYIGSQDIWAIVIIAIYFSKYGNLKLGEDHEDPEYSDGTWFAMLFACGVGVGLFFFGVAEPIWHYVGPNRYTADKYMTDNELAQNAMNLTFFHWGIHGWIVYVMVGILLAFMTFRKKLPMTMKSCFYPLIGDRIYGWMGDLIDIFSIMTTLFGVCTSLGLGTMQVNSGLNYINPDIAISTTNQVIIIWAITAVATISVITGVGVGIRRLSETCFGIGMVIMLMVFFLEDTWYMLNLYCQSIGFYFQYIIQLGFHCDAFELSTTSSGAADRGREYADGEGDGPETWMDDWTIFYWGWWISWSPFVGMFIAKISRGRTIRQFINGTLTAPMIYSFLWLTIFGGGAIRTERRAAEIGLCCPSFDSGFLDANTTMLQDLSYTGLLAQDSFKICGAEDCGDCEWGLLETYIAENGVQTAQSLVDYVNDNSWLGKYLSADERSHARLSCMASEEMWFALVSTYGDMGPFLCVISLVGIILYFVTSSDSGSLVIDIMSANGDQEPPHAQRVFWALVEGGTATALLVAGGKDALGALQTASVASGLPYTIIMCFMTISLWRALAMECGDLDPYGPDFAVALVDPFCNLKPRLWGGFLKNLFLGPVTLYNVLKQHKMGGLPAAAAAAVMMIGWISLIVAEIIYLCYPSTVQLEGIYSLAWIFYLGYVTIITATRAQIRGFYGIHGNVIEDFFACLLVYPCALIQMETVSVEGGIAPLMPDERSPNGNVYVNSEQVDTMA